MFPLKNSTTTVNAKLNNDKGNNVFQPKFINWIWRFISKNIWFHLFIYVDSLDIATFQIRSVDAIGLEINDSLSLVEYVGNWRSFVI